MKKIIIILLLLFPFSAFAYSLDEIKNIEVKTKDHDNLDLIFAYSLDEIKKIEIKIKTKTYDGLTFYKLIDWNLNNKFKWNNDDKLDYYNKLISKIGNINNDLYKKLTIILVYWRNELKNKLISISDENHNLYSCTEKWQIIYTDSNWVEIARVSNTWATISWSPEKLTCEWNIILCGDWINSWYVLSACNVWSSKVWTWSSSYWKYFQWWENIAWDNSTSVWIENNCLWNRSSQTCWNSVLSSWEKLLPNKKIWWSDILYDWWDTRWPCPSWYRILSSLGRKNIYDYWWWSSMSSDKWIAISNSLLLPIAGYRSRFDGYMFHQEIFANYWSSSYGYNLFFHSSYIGPATINNEYYGFNVRCAKNK